MDIDSLTPAELVAANLALIVAIVHLALGMLNWIRWLSVGYLVPPDVRWPLFVVSGVAILLAMPFATDDTYRRPLYVGGIVLMAGFVLGYFGWHAAGHRVPLVEAPVEVPYDLGLDFVLDHLFAGPVEFLAIASEVALAGVLIYLLVAGPRNRGGSA